MPTDLFKARGIIPKQNYDPSAVTVPQDMLNAIGDTNAGKALGSQINTVDGVPSAFDASKTKQPIDLFEARGIKPKSFDRNAAGSIESAKNGKISYKDIDYGEAARAGLRGAGDFLLSGGQGVLPMFDEVGAGLRGTYYGAKAALNGNDAGSAFNNEYNSSLTNIRNNIKNFEEQNPNKAALAKVSAGLALSGVIPSVGGETLGQTAINSAKLGGAYGLAHGFLNGEGAGDRLAQGVGEGAIYGTIGGLIPLGVAGVSKAAEPVVGAAKYGGDQISNMLSSWFNPQNAASKAIGKALIEDTPKISPQAALQLAKNKGLSLAEVGGPNVEAMADRFAQRPGSARPVMAQMMEQRVNDQASNIPDLIKSMLGDGSGTNAVELAKQAKANIAPLAQKAIAEAPTGIGADERIAGLLKNPDVKSGIPRGLQILRNEADAAGTAFNPSDYSITGFNEAGDPIISEVPNMRLIDAARRGLNAKITENSNEFGHLNDLGRSQYLLKKSMTDRLGELNPAYSDYLKNAADEFSLQRAAKLGRNIWNTPDKEETITALQGLSDPEKKMALQGAVRSLLENIEKKPDTANLASTNLNKKYYRDLLEPLVPDASKLDSLVDELKTQADVFNRNRTWLNQSRTALRQGGDQITNLTELTNAITGKLLNSDKVNAAQANMLLNRDPHAIQNAYENAMMLARKYKPQSSPFAAQPQKALPNYQTPLALFYAGSRPTSSQR